MRVCKPEHAGKWRKKNSSKAFSGRHEIGCEISLTLYSKSHAICLTRHIWPALSLTHKLSSHTSSRIWRAWLQLRPFFIVLHVACIWRVNTCVCVFAVSISKNFIFWNDKIKWNDITKTNKNCFFFVISIALKFELDLNGLVRASPSLGFDNSYERCAKMSSATTYSFPIKIHWKQIELRLKANYWD